MLFSICVPAYKALYLRECIESILEQTYKDLEIVIVDDHSPYNLAEIIETFDDDRIKYYSNENGFGGYDVVKNWNKCLYYAKGDFVICMGDDDKLTPSCLSNYVELIHKFPKMDIYHTRTLMINEHSEVVDIQDYRPESESVYSMIWNVWKGRDQYIGDFLFRTSKLKDLGGFYFLPYAWSSDKVTTFLVADEKGIANTNSIGFIYRKSSQTITNSNNSQRARYESLIGEKEWYKNFFSKECASDNVIDRDYYLLCKSKYISYMDMRLNKMIMWDIQDHPSHLWYWLSKKNQYGLRGSVCVKIVAHAIRASISRIINRFKG